MTHYNIGRYHDLIYFLEQYFSSVEAKKDDKNNWIDTSEITNNLMPFFYRNEKNISFMGNMLYESMEELIEKGDIECFRLKLMDYKTVVNDILKFYFGVCDFDFTTGISIDFISKVNRQMIASRYPERLKSNLYALFIEPMTTIQSLMYGLLNINAQLVKLYESKTRIIANLYHKLSDEKAFEIAEKFNFSKIPLSKTIYYSICLLDTNGIHIQRIGDKTVLVLGVDYEEKLQPPVLFNLEQFGSLLAEAKRIRILDFIAEKGEVNILDFPKSLTLSGSTIYYHISSMVKAGMLSARYKGKNVFYSINKNYFKIICSMLEKYYGANPH